MGKGGGQQQQVTTQETQFPAWATQAAQGNAALAKRLTDPFVHQIPQHMTAPFNADQQRGFDITRSYVTGASPITANDLGYSYYRGFADRAPYTMAQMGGIPSISPVSIDPLREFNAAEVDNVQDVKAGRFTDADLNAYMNPYIDEVVDTSLANLSNAYGRTLSAANLRQATSGAFGGARHGIREAQVADDHLRNVASTTSGLRNQAFNTAAGLIQNDQNRALQAAQANQTAAQQRALQEAQLQQEANRYATDAANQRALEQARLNQQAAQANADLTMSGRQADISARYASDLQRLGAVQNMADATLQAQQLEDQRILQNAALLSEIGSQQQQNEQAELDVPFRALEVRSNTLGATPLPQTVTNTAQVSRGGGSGKGGLLNKLIPF